MGRGTILATIGALSTLGPNSTAAADRRLPLEPGTITDWRAAGLDGTGCYWSRSIGGAVLLAVAGRKAVIRINGRVVVLEPGPGAKELFPFTYDAWVGPGVRIVISDSGIVRATGEESVTTDAAIVIVRRGAAVRHQGSMICGS